MIRAEFPRINRIPILWNRCLICSSTSFPVWLASCLASLVMSVAASPCHQDLHHHWVELVMMIVLADSAPRTWAFVWLTVTGTEDGHNYWAGARKTTSMGLSVTHIDTSH